jgi:hypothetical protein
VNLRFPDDWLLRLELLELYHNLAPNSVVAAQLHKDLVLMSENTPETKDLIQRGLELMI